MAGFSKDSIGYQFYKNPLFGITRVVIAFIDGKMKVIKILSVVGNQLTYVVVNDENGITYAKPCDTSTYRFISFSFDDTVIEREMNEDDIFLTIKDGNLPPCETDVPSLYKVVKQFCNFLLDNNGKRWGYYEFLRGVKP